MDSRFPTSPEKPSMVRPIPFILEVKDKSRTDRFIWAAFRMRFFFVLYSGLVRVAFIPGGGGVYLTNATRLSQLGVLPS